MGDRENYFYKQKGENENVATVIYKSQVPTSSSGWNEQEFFAKLGDSRNALGSHARNAEQEYLLQNMVKGAMSEAAKIALRYSVGIAVRGTSVLAHMGIESGNPTKAQEFKNKTSKDLDVLLCDELDWKDVGAVVHYDPRVGWSSSMAKNMAANGPVFKGKATDADWDKKKAHIQNSRIPKLGHLKGRMSFPSDDRSWKALKDLFLARAAEYVEEDHEYRFGHYAPYTELVGPFVRLKLRPQDNMVGDHDLFAFTTGEYGKLTHDATLGHVQIALQQANTFQAQHGGIWNWRPKEAFHIGIKTKIMGAHSPPDGDPLVYFLPDLQVVAAFYIPEDERLKSAWEYPGATKWLTTTWSGKKQLGLS